MSRETPLQEFLRNWREELGRRRREEIGRRRREPGGGPLRRRDRPEEEKERAEPVREWRSLPGGPAIAPASQRGSSGSQSRRNAPIAAPYPRGGPGRPAYLELAESLLEGGRSCSRPEPDPEPAQQSRSGGGGGLVEQLISDLNEINEVPFFDVQLPYELALQIFQNLGRTELGRCAQVSKTWKVLAEDEVLWFRICQQEGFMPEAKISDCACWKHALRDSLAKETTLRTNWKNRIGAVNQLQYELGKVLCDVHSSDGVVIAGFRE